MRPPSCARVRYAAGKLRGAARRCVAEVRPGQFWGLPVTFAATSTTIKSSAAFDGRTIPTFVDARPTQPLLTSRKGYEAAHATRAAHPTTSSRRAAVRRPRACPARYDTGRFVRPVTICELAGECTDRDRLTLVAQDRFGRRACAHKVATSDQLTAGLRRSQRRHTASWRRVSGPARYHFRWMLLVSCVCTTAICCRARRPPRPALVRLSVMSSA